MGDTAGRDPKAAAMEAVLSAELADLALAEEKGDEEVVEAFTGIGVAITKSIETGLTRVTQGIDYVRDKLVDVGEGLDEKVDEAIGLIVDPIVKGLNSVIDELTGALDPAMGVGIIVGAVVALKDDWKRVLKEGLDALWPHIIDGLIVLGETTRAVVKGLWVFFEGTIVPMIIDGLKSLGKWVWDFIPESIQSALEVVGSIYTTIVSLAADAGSFILGGLEKLLKAVGLDTLASAVGYLVDVLDALSSWLGAEKKQKFLGEGVGEGTTAAGIMGSGNVQAISMLTEAKEAGLGEGRAVGLAGMAFEDEAMANTMMQTFRAAIAAGKSPKEALSEASKFGGGAGAAAKPLGSAAAGADVGAMASDRAAVMAAAQEANSTLKKLALLQEQALNEQKIAASRSMPEVMDTVSSSDVLGMVGTGRVAGGMA